MDGVTRWWRWSSGLAVAQLQRRLSGVTISNAAVHEGENGAWVQPQHLATGRRLGKQVEQSLVAIR
ncbi:hypothetical protein [Amycolatopsis cihanbeyliensis]